MKLKKPVSGKILQHSRGMGVPTEETVARRAAELALIDGREEASPVDLQQAWHELHGDYHAAPANDEEMLASFSLQEPVSPSLGHQSGNPLAEEIPIGEELVAEGLDEAEHDLMLSSRHEIDRPDEEEES